jgi:peptidylprolyl isomerase
MYKKIITLTIALSAICISNKQAISQTNPMDTVTTASGLKYVITTKNPNGKKPNNGDKVSVHYTGRLLNDVIFDSSVGRGQPFDFKLGAGMVIRGWDEGIALLREGEKARLIIPANLGYGAQAMSTIPANSTLVFDVELVKVTEKVTPKPFDIAGKKVQTTASGLKYIMVEEGTGPQAAAGKMVSVHYTGYFTDGKIFDSSVERGEPIKFPLGQGRVIKGWEEGIALLKVKGKAHLIIPYNLAYGEQGRPPQIPAKSDLIFDVELIGVEDVPGAVGK